jgi:hypothetical protein
VKSVLTHANAHERLAEAIPELRAALDRELLWWSGDAAAPPQHIIFGSVLVPFLVDKLRAGQEDDEAVQRAFTFVERLATCGDDEAANLVYATIAAELGDDRVVLQRARRVMGPETLRLSRQVEKFYGRSDE